MVGNMTDFVIVPALRRFEICLIKILTVQEFFSNGWVWVWVHPFLIYLKIIILGYFVLYNNNNKILFNKINYKNDYLFIKIY